MNNRFALACVDLLGSACENCLDLRVNICLDPLVKNCPDLRVKQMSGSAWEKLPGSAWVEKKSKVCRIRRPEQVDGLIGTHRPDLVLTVEGNEDKYVQLQIPQLTVTLGTLVLDQIGR